MNARARNEAPLVPSHTNEPMRPGAPVKQPKHVIIVTDYAWVIGGASNVAMMNAIALAERGYDTHHFSVVGPVAAPLAASGVTVHCLGQPSTLNEPSRVVGAQSGLWNRQAAKAFERLLSRFPPAESLVHVHQWTKALSPSIFETIVRLGFRFVVTLHDYFGRGVSDVMLRLRGLRQEVLAR